MIVFRYFLVLNLAFTACNGNLWTDKLGETAITEPFEFEKWSKFVNISRKSFIKLLKNPISYSGKLATEINLSLEPISLTKVDLDKNV